MGPREAAALVAREADAGVAAALTAIDASRALVPEAVVARVASVPAGVTDLEDVIWQAEVHLVAGQGGASADDGGVIGGTTASPLAALPVGAIRGAGPVWERRLTQAGLATIGALALATPAELGALVRAVGAHVVALAGLARVAVQPWPPVPASAATWGSVLQVARTDPGHLPGDRVLTHAAWALAVELLGAVDGDALAGLRFGRS